MSWWRAEFVIQNAGRYDIVIEAETYDAAVARLYEKFPNAIDPIITSEEPT